jgi:hypothetical protein
MLGSPRNFDYGNCVVVHMETLLADLSQAVRGLRRSPGFAAAVIGIRLSRCTMNRTERPFRRSETCATKQLTSSMWTDYAAKRRVSRKLCCSRFMSASTSGSMPASRQAVRMRMADGRSSSDSLTTSARYSKEAMVEEERSGR